MADETLIRYMRDGRFAVEIRVNKAVLARIVDAAFDSADADDMRFTQPKHHGEYPFHVREVDAKIVVRTTDRRKRG